MPERKDRPELVTWSELVPWIKLSKSTIQRLIRKGAFPKPISLSKNRVAFLEGDVLNWLNTRL